MGLVGAIACLKVAEQPVAGAGFADAFDPKSDVTLANLLHATCFNSMCQTKSAVISYNIDPTCKVYISFNRN